MEEKESQINEVDLYNTYYPLTKVESILGAGEESFAAWNLYNALQNSIQFADYKINLLFVIAGIILSMVISSTPDFNTDPLVYKICYVFFLLVTVPFVYYGIRTIAPQTISKPDVKSKKLYFFIEIASMTTSEYIHKFRSSPRKEHYDELLLQIHNLSKITKAKFGNYAKALYYLCVMMAMLVIMLLFKAFV